MKGFWSIAIDHETGIPISSCSVYVYTSAGALATIYQDENGATAESNPLTTDTKGRFKFYCASGKYYMTFSKTGYTSWTSPYITIDDEVDIDSIDSTLNKLVSNKIIHDIMTGRISIRYDNVQFGGIGMDLIRLIMKGLKSSLP